MYNVMYTSENFFKVANDYKLVKENDEKYPELKRRCTVKERVEHYRNQITDNKVLRFKS